MSWGYLGRMIAWAALISGFVWVAVEGFARSAPAGAARRPQAAAAQLSPGDADDPPGSGRPGAFRLLSRFVNRPVAFARENWVFLAEITILCLLGWGSLARGLGVYDLVYAESQWVRFV